MKSLRLRLIAANQALAVLELETFRSSHALGQLRSALGNLGVRWIASDGNLLDGGIRERIYIGNTDGSPLTPTRLGEIHARACEAFDPDLTFPPEHRVQVAANG